MQCIMNQHQKHEEANWKSIGSDFALQTSLVYAEYVLGITDMFVVLEVVLIIGWFPYLGGEAIAL